MYGKNGAPISLSPDTMPALPRFTAFGTLSRAVGGNGGGRVG